MDVQWQKLAAALHISKESISKITNINVVCWQSLEREVNVVFIYLP